MDRIIRTVTGDIPAKRLGFCDSHEHLFIADGRSRAVNPSLYMEDYARSAMEARLYAGTGGCALVDAQPVGCGRMAEDLRRLSLDTGVRVIAVTGFHRLCFYPEEHWIHALDEDRLAHIFIHEIDTGMYVGCDAAPPANFIDAQAGLIKIALERTPTAGRLRTLIRAAAKAHVRTGAPVICHTERGKHAVELINGLCAGGVMPQSIIICHADRTTNHPENILAIAKTGAYLEFDTIARPKYHTDEEEIDLILKVLEAGYGDQLLLGLDCTNERLKAYGGSVGLDYLPRVFLPKLINGGVNHRFVCAFFVDNPARAFSFQPRQRN